ncbi:MAG: hypothetical protein GY702_09170 [Desulfobulbaceae bacterium]|nr:hypothetical protein [Desulfobulbaceae bacterium]
MKITPSIKIVFGFFIGLGGMFYDTGIREIDTILTIIGLVGFAIFIDGTRQLQKQGGKDVKNPWI